MEYGYAQNVLLSQWKRNLSREANYGLRNVSGHIVPFARVEEIKKYPCFPSLKYGMKESVIWMCKITRQHFKSL